MTPYYFLYVLVLCGTPICFLNDLPARRLAQKVYFISILLILSTFAGARAPGVDYDYQNYVFWFNAIAKGTATQMAWLRDPTFALLSFIVSRLGLAYPVVATLYAFLGISATIAFATLVVAPRWSTLLFYLFFCHYYLVEELVLIRSAVAIPLMAVSLYFACKQRPRRAIALFLLALLFHFSVIVALPVLLLIIANVKFRSKAWIYFLIVFGVGVAATMKAVVAYLSGLYRISEYVSAKRPEGSLPGLSWYAAAHLLTIAFCVFFLWNRLSRYQRVAILLSGLGLCLFQIFISNGGLASRFTNLLDIF